VRLYSSSPRSSKLKIAEESLRFDEGTGILLVAFSAVMLAGRPRRQLARGGAGADAAIGFAGGIMGGLAGLSGPLPTMWATLRAWGKDERQGMRRVAASCGAQDQPTRTAGMGGLC
jgi:hypothetical protein